MHACRKILFPLSWLYGAILALRHLLYDKKILSSVAHPVPLIGIGNLSFGGTGKTPMTEYLIRLLKDRYRMAVLSRGYKRATSGFYLAREGVSVRDIGDEPFQYYKKFPGIEVAVDADRNRGIARLLQLPIPPEVILLDDAFQHRKIQPGLHILLTTCDDLYVDDFLFPAGNLRDLKSRAARADLIIVTKCPTALTGTERLHIKNKLNLKPRQQIFFSGITYANELVSATEKLQLKALQKEPFTLVTGIARPGPLVRFLKEKGLTFGHIRYPDHYEFTEKDIALLQRKTRVITTEKDYMRLQHRLPGVYYLPIQTTFLEEEATFISTIERFIKSYGKV